MTEKLACPSRIVVPWSGNADATLRRMAAEGAWACEIGEALGRSKNSVIGRSHRLGVQLFGGNSGPKPQQAAKPRAPRPVKPPVQPPAVTPDLIPPIAPLPAETFPQMISLVQLRERTCRWPYGDPKQDSFRFCGNETDGIGPYCAEHHAMSIVKTKAA